LARNVEISRDILNKVPNMLNMGPVPPALYINGKSFSDGEINAYSSVCIAPGPARFKLILTRLLKTIREERDLVLSLSQIGLTPKQAIRMISDSIIGTAQTEDDPSEGTVDASDREEGGDVVVYWNDIEKDSRSVSSIATGPGH
jgi:UDP-glucose:glycoprotein glucosyltransferase